MFTKILLQIPQEFFTIQSMLTLTGATGATFVIANGLQLAFNFNPKWLALLIAILISLFGVYQSHKPGTLPVLSDYFIGLINGFLIYCTTVGATQMASEKNESNQPIITERGSSSLQKRTFLTPWF